MKTNEIIRLGKEDKPMKILLFDIETSAIPALVWHIRDIDRIAKKLADEVVLSFSAKWYGTNKVITRGLDDYKGTLSKGFLHLNDKPLIQTIWNLFKEADAVVTHNGSSFDIKRCMARFIVHELGHPNPFMKSIDLYQVSKSKFGFLSQKQDDIARQTGSTRKLEHEGIDMWWKCMNGDKASWKQLKRYNAGDIVTLEENYRKILPYMTNHPNWNVYLGTTHACPNCSGTTTQRRGMATTRTQTYQRYQCQDCGAWSRGEVVKRPKVIVR